MNLKKFNNALSNIDEKYLKIADNYSKNLTINNEKTLGFLTPFKICLSCFLLLFLISTVYAITIFSPINGDDFSISSTYEGNGIINVSIENKSKKDLKLDENIKIILWSTNEEIPKYTDEIEFSDTLIKARSSKTISINLSKVYDMEALEKKLDNDHYYLILTNNNFEHGYDYHCTILFNEVVTDNSEKNKEETKALEIKPVKNNHEILEELKPFFEKYIIEHKMKNENILEYYQIVDKIIERETKNGKRFITTSNPQLFVSDPQDDIIFDHRISTELQYQLIGEHHYSLSAYNIPVGSTYYDDCMVLSTYLPQRKSDIYDTGGAELQLAYIFQYDVTELKKENSYVFIYGRIFDYDNLEQYKLYEDDKYVSYNMTDLFYDNLENHFEIFTNERSDIFIDEEIKDRVYKIYNYLMKKENLKFYYHN